MIARLYGKHGKVLAKIKKARPPNFKFGPFEDPVEAYAIGYEFKGFGEVMRTQFNYPCFCSGDGATITVHQYLEIRAEPTRVDYRTGRPRRD